MDKKCGKCKQLISAEDFLCPHCGAIQGEESVLPAAVSEINRPNRQALRKILPWVCGALLVAVVIFAIILLWNGFVNTQTPSTAPSDPKATQTTAPLVVYEVLLKNSAKRPMKDVHIDVYHGTELFYSCESSQYGKATFILPQSDDYYLKLSNLPIPYCFTHEDMQFYFPEGQQELELELEKLDVPYTVKVVNGAGEPVKDVMIEFGSENLLTDEQGVCTYYREYLHSGMYIRVLYAPTGYYSAPTLVHFADDSFELEIVLQRIEEVQPEEDQQFYTLSIIDEYGDPVVGQRFGITYGDDFNQLEYAFYTNSDGFATFIAQRDAEVSIGILEQPDYYGKLYPYEQGSTHQQIQLEIRKTAFVYTIQFVNQKEEPIPGVQIAVYYRYSDEKKLYTSDENGITTIISEEPNPENLRFFLTDVPVGYKLDLEMTEIHYFPNYSRNTVIELMHQTTITLVDDQGAPIVGAVLLLDDIFDFTYNLTGITNENGQWIFSLPANMTFMVKIVSLPEGYDHLFFLSEYIDGTELEIAIEPYQVIDTYHVYLNDPEGFPVANAQINLYLQSGDVFPIITDDEGYSQFSAWTDIQLVIDGVGLGELPDEYAGYDFYTIEYGEGNCIYITISPQRISGQE